MATNKSKDPPGLFHLKDGIAQLDRYMNAADKRVPIFLVIAPASELKALAEE